MTLTVTQTPSPSPSPDPDPNPNPNPNPNPSPNQTLPELLAPGGIVVWSTFLEGCELIAPPFRTSRRFEFGQMRRICGEEAGFTVICDEQGELITRGKWVPAQFYAAIKN